MAKKDRVLVTDTYVTDTETGQSEVFGAGTQEADIPKNFLERITNDSAWGDSGVEEDEEGNEVLVHDWASENQKTLMEEVRKRQEAGRPLAPASNKKEDLVEALEYDDQAAVSSTAQVDV